MLTERERVFYILIEAMFFQLFYLLRTDDEFTVLLSFLGVNKSVNVMEDWWAKLVGAAGKKGWETLVSFWRNCLAITCRSCICSEEEVR